MSAVDKISTEREVAGIMAAWRADLAARIARARLRYEATGNGREEIIQLGDEWRQHQGHGGIPEGAIRMKMNAATLSLISTADSIRPVAACLTST